jgi:hypothetical protein
MKPLLLLISLILVTVSSKVVHDTPVCAVPRACMLSARFASLNSAVQFSAAGVGPPNEFKLMVKT